MSDSGRSARQMNSTALILRLWNDSTRGITQDKRLHPPAVHQNYVTVRQSMDCEAAIKTRLGTSGNAFNS